MEVWHTMKAVISSTMVTRTMMWHRESLWRLSMLLVCTYFKHRLYHTSSICERHNMKESHFSLLISLGWNFLSITTTKGIPNDIQAYAAGYLEGALTYKQIYYNIKNRYGGKEPSDHVSSLFWMISLFLDSCHLNEQRDLRGHREDQAWCRSSLLGASYSAWHSNQRHVRWYPSKCSFWICTYSHGYFTVIDGHFTVADPVYQLWWRCGRLEWTENEERNHLFWGYIFLFSIDLCRFPWSLFCFDSC